MKETRIYYKKVKLKDPIMIVGLPGIGSVGSLVAECMRTALKAKKFGTLYSPHFPFQIIMLKDGRFRLVSNRFYYFKDKKAKNDIVLLIGDAQPLSSEGQYEVNEKIVEFFKTLGGRKIYTIGGYTLGNQYIKSPKVFGVATDKETRDYLKKFGVVAVDAPGTAIVGSAGMIVAFSKKHKVGAACMMGETGLLEADANSAKAVLAVIGKMLGIKIDQSSIDRLKVETERMIRELEEAARAAMPQQQLPERPGEQRPGEGLTYIR